MASKFMTILLPEQFALAMNVSNVMDVLSSTPGIVDGSRVSESTLRSIAWHALAVKPCCVTV
jgi:hypothetical protein